MLLAADYPFLDVFWTLCILFAYMVARPAEAPA